MKLASWLSLEQLYFHHPGGHAVAPTRSSVITMTTRAKLLRYAIELGTRCDLSDTPRPPIPDLPDTAARVSPSIRVKRTRRASDAALLSRLARAAQRGSRAVHDLAQKLGLRVDQPLGHLQSGVCDLLGPRASLTIRRDCLVDRLGEPAYRVDALRAPSSRSPSTSSESSVVRSTTVVGPADALVARRLGAPAFGALLDLVFVSAIASCSFRDQVISKRERYAVSRCHDSRAKPYLRRGETRNSSQRADTPVPIAERPVELERSES